MFCLKRTPGHTTKVGLRGGGRFLAHLVSARTMQIFRASGYGQLNQLPSVVFPRSIHGIYFH